MTYSPLNAPRNDEFLRLRANAIALGRSSLLKGEFLYGSQSRLDSTLACLVYLIARWRELQD